MLVCVYRCFEFKWNAVGELETLLQCWEEEHDTLQVIVQLHHLKGEVNAEMLLMKKQPLQGCRSLKKSRKFKEGGLDKYEGV